MRKLPCPSCHDHNHSVMCARCCALYDSFERGNYEGNITAIAAFASAESTRARREGMEEAAGIVSGYARHDNPNAVTVCDLAATAILDAAKEVDGKLPCPSCHGTEDTQEQARALVEPFEKADRTTVYLNWGILRDRIAAALDRARREESELLLDRIVGSLKAYPKLGGDVRIMAEV